MTTCIITVSSLITLQFLRYHSLFPQFSKGKYICIILTVFSSFQWLFSQLIFERQFVKNVFMKQSSFSNLSLFEYLWWKIILSAIFQSFEAYQPLMTQKFALNIIVFNTHFPKVVLLEKFHFIYHTRTIMRSKLTRYFMLLMKCLFLASYSDIPNTHIIVKFLLYIHMFLRQNSSITSHDHEKEEHFCPIYIR